MNMIIWLFVANWAQKCSVYWICLCFLQKASLIFTSVLYGQKRRYPHSLKMRKTLAPRKSRRPLKGFNSGFVWHAQIFEYFRFIVFKVPDFLSIFNILSSAFTHIFRLFNFVVVTVGEGPEALTSSMSDRRLGWPFRPRVLLLLVLLYTLFSTVAEAGSIKCFGDFQHWAFSANCTSADSTRNCVDGLVVPLWRPFFDLSFGDRVLRGGIYFFVIIYMFLGVSIVADRFMSGIEVITRYPSCKICCNWNLLVWREQSLSNGQVCRLSDKYPSFFTHPPSLSLYIHYIIQKVLVQLNLWDKERGISTSWADWLTDYKERGGGV